jgi:phosphonate degradation associated HDIG domain protein
MNTFYPSDDSAIQSIVEEIFALYARHGADDYIGEPVSQLEHMAQSAQLAEAEGFDDEVIIAAFLHDIGHFCSPRQEGEDMGGYGTMRHEKVGADWLRVRGFSEKVAKLIENHVQAKRYLVYKHPSYLEKLSEASKQTLAYQGGAMGEEEALAFEHDPLFKASLRMRVWDERAKVEHQPLPDLGVYKAMCCAHLMRQKEANRLTGEQKKMTLSASQRAFWEANGYLHLKGMFSPEEQVAMRGWVEDLEQRPETPGKWMKYFETSAKGGRLLCRVERFLEYHEEFDKLLRGPSLLGLLSELMGEEAVLYKEKINYKLPGGNGFGAHQDAPAFTTFGQTYHITLMISIDASTPENGCLEMVPGFHKQGILPSTPSGEVDPEFAETLTWSPVPTEAGDVLLFDSYIPHRSDTNRSERPRRALYITYNRASEGSFREEYYAQKRAVFPPECEREPGKDYSDTGVFNIGNPVRVM